VEVTEHFLARIESLDPTLNAFRLVDRESARVQAKAAEVASKRGERLGPLHGIPIAVKEQVRLKGVVLMPTMPNAAPAGADDILVERLREAGAIIVGTTTMPGMGRAALMFQTDMDLAKHPRNPWDPTRIPGSSSSGSAAAVAAGMLPLTIGTDGGGSTRLPAALSGTIGVHTSRGRIPYVNYDNPGYQFTISSAPMTRDMRDAALVMSVICGADGRDPACLEDDVPDFVGAVSQDAGGMRFAWTDDFGFASMYGLAQTPAVIAAVRSAAEGFKKLGAKVERTNEKWEDFYHGFLTFGAAYREGPAQRGEKPTVEQIRTQSELRGRNWDRFMRLLEDHDVLLSPTIQFTAFTVEEWDAAWNKDGEKYPHGTFAPTYTADTHMFNWLGWPALSIPVGFVNGLPVGMQLITRPNREAQLYRAAAAFLKAYPRNERPTVS
jgi:Asp-tRNA(Asn)/Glu-tRNA(Gln) amidotransferase A subunit family amidase